MLRFIYKTRHSIDINAVLSQSLVHVDFRHTKFVLVVCIIILMIRILVYEPVNYALALSVGDKF
jgi:hypothetical protein